MIKWQSQLLQVQTTTLDANFCSQDGIMRITIDPFNHPNVPDDVGIVLKPHAPHIKFVDVNNDNKFLVVIFIGLATEHKERLVNKEKSLCIN
ncbi:hypothetical protein DEO72_LG10g1519 [Vigna unguiculata]|uniref:Uncharacterized protein n=1 Tax=Vigna unguiculata TaxID=3917 RepID=A0A4D6NBN8_VIGUN|nr:hypothetical protein DEO72_LG10g1519 [Vigna unguiculata]